MSTWTCWWFATTLTSMHDHKYMWNIIFWHLNDNKLHWFISKGTVNSIMFPFQHKFLQVVLASLIISLLWSQYQFSLLSIIQFSSCKFREFGIGSTDKGWRDKKSTFFSILLNKCNHQSIENVWKYILLSIFFHKYLYSAIASFQKVFKYELFLKREWWNFFFQKSEGGCGICWVSYQSRNNCSWGYTAWHGSHKHHLFRFTGKGRIHTSYYPSLRSL